MLFCKLFFLSLVLSSFLQLTKSQRRINHGNKTRVPKPYMVYIVKAEESPLLYDFWICGGVIVSQSFIITSGACVEDVQFMYAVAAYERYIPPNSPGFASDECIKQSKKKIVFTCTPKNYDFQYDAYSKWANIDIALVKVESPYDFHGGKPAQVCTWVPHPIDISYDPKHSEPDRDAMVLGWGHSEKWRLPEDTKDYNSDYLQYAPVSIMNKKECIERYQTHHPEMVEVIEKYMICTILPGSIDDNGTEISTPTPNLDGCVQVPDPITGRLGACLDASRAKAAQVQSKNYGRMRAPQYDYDNRRINSRTNTSDNSQWNNTGSLSDSNAYSLPGQYYQYYQPETSRRSGNNSINNNDTVSSFRESINPKLPTRRHGICQNDHGGPLVTWVGSEEILIGIASVFLVTNNSMCTGPFLYTSTQCSGAFLGCVLGAQEIADDDGDRRRFRRMWSKGFDSRVCNLPPEMRGFRAIERRISWMNHPDGPAANELPVEDLFERPQVSLNRFNYDSEDTRRHGNGNTSYSVQKT